MRQFVVLGHDAPTTAEFSLDDIPGAGRLDVLCRCVNSAFFLSHAIREDVRVHLVLSDAYVVRFDGTELRRLNPDERSTAALIRGALDASERAIGAMEATSSPGVYVRKGDFASVVRDLASKGTLVELHEDGVAAPAIEPPDDPVFVLSDHHEFSDAEAALLADRADDRVSLGPHALHADHAITVAHNWLDTSGFDAWA